MSFLQSNGYLDLFNDSSIVLDSVSPNQTLFSDASSNVVGQSLTTNQIFAGVTGSLPTALLPSLTAGPSLTKTADWPNFALDCVQDIRQTASPTFVSETLSGLTASSLVYANASKLLSSVTLGSQINGSSLTFSGGVLQSQNSQDLQTSASPLFSGMTISGNMTWASTGAFTATFGNGSGASTFNLSGNANWAANNAFAGLTYNLGTNSSDSVAKTINIGNHSSTAPSTTTLDGKVSIPSTATWTSATALTMNTPSVATGGLQIALSAAETLTLNNMSATAGASVNFYPSLIGTGLSYAKTGSSSEGATPWTIYSDGVHAAHAALIQSWGNFQFMCLANQTTATNLSYTNTQMLATEVMRISPTGIKVYNGGSAGTTVFNAAVSGVISTVKNTLDDSNGNMTINGTGNFPLTINSTSASNVAQLIIEHGGQGRLYVGYDTTAGAGLWNGNGVRILQQASSAVSDTSLLTAHNTLDDGVSGLISCGAYTTTPQALITNASKQLVQGTVNLASTNFISGILGIANGGSGSSSPALVAGSNISLSGSWPSQTIATVQNPTFTGLETIQCADAISTTNLLLTKAGTTTCRRTAIGFQPALSGTAFYLVTDKAQNGSDDWAVFHATNSSWPLWINSSDGLLSKNNTLDDSNGNMSITGNITNIGTTASPFVLFAKTARAGPAAVVAGDLLAQVGFVEGYDGSSYQIATDIASEVDGAVSAGKVPGRMKFYCADSTGTAKVNLLISSNRSVATAFNDLDDGTGNLIIGNGASIYPSSSINNGGANAPIASFTFGTTLQYAKKSILSGTLSSGQIQFLTGSGGGGQVTIMNAPGANLILVPMYVAMNYVYGGTAYTNGSGLICLSMPGGIYFTSSAAPGFLGLGTTQMRDIHSSNSYGAVSLAYQYNTAIANQPLQIAISGFTAAYITGNGTISYWVEYLILPVA